MDVDGAFDLERFVAAQRPVFPQVEAELTAGEKRSHWMWFVFPQVQGLGSSPMAQRYAIQNLEEACAYLRHPLLGPRLRECVGLVNAHAGRRGLDRIFGYPDDLKFHSSVTLFARADSQEGVFAEALRLWFGGRLDSGTLAQVGHTAPR